MHKKILESNTFEKKMCASVCACLCDCVCGGHDRVAWIEAHALTMVEEIDLCKEPVLGQKGAECTSRVTFDL